MYIDSIFFTYLRVESRSFQETSPTLDCPNHCEVRYVSRKENARLSFGDAVDLCCVWNQQTSHNNLTFRLFTHSFVNNCATMISFLTEKNGDDNDFCLPIVWFVICVVISRILLYEFANGCSDWSFFISTHHKDKSEFNKYYIWHMAVAGGINTGIFGINN